MFRNLLASVLCSVVIVFSASASATCGAPTSWNLYAGQTALVGSVSVTNDMDNLYVTYAIDTVTQPVATFGTLHLWVGSDLQTMPRSGGGAPIPGQFPFHMNTNGAQSHTFTIPFSELAIQDASSACGLPLYVVAHAEVNGVMDENGGLSGETAFSGDMEGDGNRWWFYGVYTVQCDCGGEPPLGRCETAYGKGGYVWTTMKRSNPEKLPTLALTHNRWGWVVNMTEPGTQTNPMYAGAGLNNVSKGTHVGDVTITWDGSEVTVTYTMFSGNMMKETHIYAGDQSPTTIAPGQYGSTGYFGDDGVSTHSETFEVSDSDGDGIWVVAHSVSCF